MSYITNTTSTCSTTTIQLNAAQADAHTITTPQVQDHDWETFKAIAQMYYDMEKDLKATSILTAVPLINLVQDQIGIVLNNCCNTEPNFPTRVLGKKAGQQELLKEFFLSLDQFKTKKNQEAIVDFLNACLIKMYDSKNNNMMQYTFALDPMIKLFESQRLDLFHKNSRHFVKGDQHSSNAEKYRIAVKSHQYLHRVIDFHYCIVGFETTNYINKYLHETNGNIVKEISKLSKLNIEILLNNTSLKKEHQCAISRLFKNLWDEFDKDNALFIEKLMEVFHFDIRDNYLNVIQSPAVDKICQTKMSHGVFQNMGDDSFDSQYVQKNYEVYEQFLPRIVEVTRWLASIHEKLSKRALLLREFHFFIKYGDLNRLTEKLSKLKSPSYKKQEEILLEEIEIFVAKKRTDTQMAINIVSTINTCKLMPLYNFFLHAEDFHKKSNCVLSVLFDDALEFAQRRKNDLFIFPPETVSNIRPNQTRPTKQTGPNTNQVTTTPKSSSKAVSTPEIPSLTVEDEKMKGMYPLLECLQGAQGSAATSFRDLCLGCKKDMGIEKALRNAQNQLNGLLSTMLRLTEGSQKPLTRPEVHAFVIDAVSHATLMSEQMLLALCLSTNDNKPESTHDLYFILLNCKFKGGSFPQKLRKWIQEANRGEILVRNLDECALGNSPLQNLLAKTKLFVEGSDAFTAEEILSETIEFCRNAGRLVHALQIQINAAKAKPQKNVSENFINAFSSLCKKLSEQVKEIKLSPSTENAFTHSLRKTLHGHSEKTEIPLNNALNNLLLHLETEMASHATLHPIFAHAHCSHVLLLNQMIAEEVLLTLINHSMVSSYFGEDHNLFAMAELLGMTQKDFTPDELDFLKRGKAVRQLVRYPESCDMLNAKNSIKDTVQQSAELASSQKYTEFHGGEGFQLPSNSKLAQKLESIKKVIAKDVEILGSVLAKIIKKLTL